jgi:hypothetical protein
MEKPNREIESFYRRKIRLFQELVTCLSLERENLVQPNTDNLWSLAEQKNCIAESIKETSRMLKTAMEEAGAGGEIFAEGGLDIQKLNLEIGNLKEEIKERVRENMAFARETLAFFDEIIAMMTSATTAGPPYGSAGRNAKALHTLAYYKEV